MIVGFWFEKYRSLATGIAVCGSSVGGFAFTPLFQKLQEAVGWRYTLLIIGGIVLNCIWAGCLFKSVPGNNKSDLESNSNNVEKNKTEATQEPQLAQLTQHENPQSGENGLVLNNGKTNEDKLQARLENLKLRKISVRAKSERLSGRRDSGNITASDGELRIISKTIPEEDEEAEEKEQSTQDGQSTPKQKAPSRYKKRTAHAGTSAYNIGDNTGNFARSTQSTRQLQAGRILAPIEMRKYHKEVRKFAGSIVALAQFTSDHDPRWKSRGSRSSMSSKTDEYKSKEKVSLKSGEEHVELDVVDGTDGDEEEMDCVERMISIIKRFFYRTFDPSLLKSPTYLLVLFSSFFSLFGNGFSIFPCLILNVASVSSLSTGILRYLFLNPRDSL